MRRLLVDQRNRLRALDVTEAAEQIVRSQWQLTRAARIAAACRELACARQSLLEAQKAEDCAAAAACEQRLRAAQQHIQDLLHRFAGEDDAARTAMLWHRLERAAVQRTIAQLKRGLRPPSRLVD